MISNKNNQLITLAIADDNLLILQLMCNHINGLEGCHVLLSAANGEELLNQLSSQIQQIDIAILDIMMQPLNGYETARIIRKKHPHTLILFYSQCKSELAFAQMAAAGGHGLISKWGNAAQIEAAIKAVRGGNYFFPEINERIEMANEIFFDKEKAGINELTAQEIAFLQLIGSDKTYKEMGVQLNIEDRKLDYIREGLFKKLQVKSRTGLAILAYQSGISA